MLKLENIKKEYQLSGGMKVEALRGVSLRFRKSEFVSVLGPSGCGKTTLLNVIGGLDRPTSGTLYINGRSTAHYGSRDWDTYRNHSIGFVFQTYNLIPHMTVLANVELAPIIAGVSKAERRKRAVSALEKVGLGDQLNKKPNQLSGGQMQRVAIARALVNDPEILLADEPTGALDTKTSVQIMDILREIAKDRLIIMVTHNPDIANVYSTRIVRLKDGLIVDDSNPYEPDAPEAASAPGENASDKNASDKNASDKNASDKNASGARDAENGGARTTKDASFARAVPAPTPSAAENAGKDENGQKKKTRQKKKASMSFFTALSLSARNLLTKKARTVLTAFAGSIGIIGIAAILAMSSGAQAYIDKVQEDTLSSYPLYLVRESADSGAIFSVMSDARSTGNAVYEEDKIYPDDTLVSLFKALSNKKTHDLPSFKKYLTEHMDELSGTLNAVSYSYDLDVNVYAKLPDGSYMQSNPSTIFDYMGEQMRSYSAMLAMSGNSDFFSEMLEGNNGELINPVVLTQYSLLGGKWPENAHEVVLMVDENNRISNVSLYALGVKDPNELEKRIEKALAAAATEDAADDEAATAKETPIEVEKLLGYTFYLVPNVDFFVEDGRSYTVNGKEYPVWTDLREDVNFDLEGFLIDQKHGVPLTVVGVLKKNPDAATYSIGTPIGYTAALTREIIAYNNDSKIARQQTEQPEYDVFTGLSFESASLTPDRAGEFLALIPADKKAELLATLKETVKTSLNEDALPELLAALDDKTFSMLVQYAAPQKTYTKEQAAEFAASLSEEQTAQLIALLQNYGVFDVTPETLPATLAALPDAQFSMIASMFSAPAYTKENIPEFLESLGADGRKKLVGQIKENFEFKESDLESYLKKLPKDQFARFVAYYLGEPASFDKNLTSLGYQDDSRIRRISLYAVDFEAKDALKAFVDRYNELVKNGSVTGADETPAGEVELTDVMGSLLSGVNTIINVISIVLIIFVAISLVVSSIMIAIITYISVLERIKEIGILRSLGASKKNVSEVFIAETMIEGFISGVLGVGVTLLLCLIANPIIHKLTNINAINAFLPPAAAFILVGISVLLTVIAGFVPALIAAHKDPVIALRSE